MGIKHWIADWAAVGMAAWFGLAASASAATVTFIIKTDNGAEPWNTQATMVTAKVGDTVHIVNDDTVDHRLHTGGEPCDDGPDMAPGEAYDCVVDEAFDPAANGPLYDDDFGKSAAFWLTVTE